MASLDILQDHASLTVPEKPCANGMLPLRGHGPLVEPFPEKLVPLPGRAVIDPPRALKSLARIIDTGLCHRCGSCVGICPTNVLAVDDEEYPVVKNLSACTDCDLCVKICPGDEFDAKKFAQDIFGKVPETEDVYGEFSSGYVAHASDPKIRSSSTSGGLVTAFLIGLLELGLVDGCIVVTADEKVPFKGVPKVARTKEDILAAMKSKYAIVPTNVALKEVLQVPGRYVLVGLPCHIHGFRKGADLDRRLRERVVFTLALICHAAVEHEPLKIMYQKLGKMKEDVASFIYRLEKHPGSSYVTLKNGSYKPVMFPHKTGYQPTAIELMNTLYRLYTPSRCLTCYDSMGEFADMSVGDPWMPKPFDDIDFHDGYTFLINRTPRAEEFFSKVVKADYLKVRKLSRESTRTSNLAMGTEKRYRAFRLLKSRDRQGLPVPDYGFEIPSPSLKHGLLTEVNIATHLFCFIPRWSKYVLHFALSEPGYLIYWLNNKRRKLRTWRRDFIAKIKRKKQRECIDERW